MRIFILTLSILFAVEAQNINAQTAVKFNLNYSLSDSNKVVRDFRMYLGQINFLLDERVVYHDQSFHLIDLLHGKKSFEVDLPPDLSYDKVVVHLGTDSTTNDSGYLEGDLDPMIGMYWTWQSGYINFKLEVSESDRYLEHHLGGFLHPYETQQAMEFETTNTEINLVFDLDQYLNAMLTEKVYKIMSTGAKAKQWSEIAAEHFKLQTP